jgi:hypothetical protein
MPLLSHASLMANRIPYADTLVDLSKYGAQMTNPLIVSAPLHGLNMEVDFTHGGPGYWVTVLGGDHPDHTPEYELTANAFGLLAVLVTGPHAEVVVLSRKSASAPFDALGLFSAHDALAVVARLGGKG